MLYCYTANGFLPTGKRDFGELQMNDINSMSRDLKKKQLRSRVITPGQSRPQAQPPGEDGQEIVKQAHRRVVRRRRILLALLLIVFLGAV